MYSVTSANVVSSINTPYAIQNGPLGYGDCGQKIKADYGNRAIPSYLSEPQKAYWSPTPSDVDHHVTLKQFANPDPLIQGTGIILPEPDRYTYPLVTENFVDKNNLGKLVSVDCGLYACGPNMPVYKTYENYMKSSEYNGPSTLMVAVATVAAIAAILYLARR